MRCGNRSATRTPVAASHSRNLLSKVEVGNIDSDSLLGAYGVKGLLTLCSERPLLTASHVAATGMSGGSFHRFVRKLSSETKILKFDLSRRTRLTNDTGAQGVKDFMAKARLDEQAACYDSCL